MVAVLPAWLLFAFLAFTSAAVPDPAKPPHPLYVSVTEIDENGAEGSLEISCKFFADDFEHTLEKAYHAKLDLAAEGNKALLDKYIADYVGKHFHLAADGKGASLRYVGYEKEKESVYCYFEAAHTTVAKRLEVSSDMLYDYTAEQINIVHVTVKGQRKSSKLTSPQVKSVFPF